MQKKEPFALEDYDSNNVKDSEGAINAVTALHQFGVNTDGRSRCRSTCCKKSFECVGLEMLDAMPFHVLWNHKPNFVHLVFPN